MDRPDWRITGAAGLLAGLTIGGFSLVSVAGAEPTVAPIVLRTADPTAAPPGGSPRVSFPASPTQTPIVIDPVASIDSPDVVAPPVISERRTPAPTPVVDGDSVSVASSD